MPPKWPYPLITGCQEFQWLEFYAGKGNCTLQMRRAGYVSGRFDILYCDQTKQGKRKSNWHDLQTPAGFVLLRFTQQVVGDVGGQNYSYSYKILQDTFVMLMGWLHRLYTVSFLLPPGCHSEDGTGVHHEAANGRLHHLVWHKMLFLHWCKPGNQQAQCLQQYRGYKCTFSELLQRVTGEDSPRVPLCNTTATKSIPNVRVIMRNPFQENTFRYFSCYFERFCLKNPARRTILLIMLVAAKFGVWVLEQPGTSVLEFYPAFLHLTHCHYQLFGDFGAQTPVCSQLCLQYVLQPGCLKFPFVLLQRKWY